MKQTKSVSVAFGTVVTLLEWIFFLPTLALLPAGVAAQNYEVADIDCAVGTNGRELLSARLRRPEGFRGVPIFADDTSSSSSGGFDLDGMGLDNRLLHQDLHSGSLIKDPPCQIFPDPTDSSGRVFVLRVSDFSQCGVLKRNGFIHVRVWFPQLPGVVMLSDQEVIIMCKPPSLTITQSKTAGFAGSIPNGARVSGIVEESPGRLEYEVALFRETTGGSGAGGAGRSVPPGSENGLTGGGGPPTSTYVTGINSQELPVDQAVPIGTRLQLRAKISPDSVWQHAKLMEVSVSPDPKNPTADGSVALVKDGCRNPELASIIPKQPYRFKERTNEVVLDFEAFLLSNMGDRSTLWLHTQIKACMEPQDCVAQFCTDVYQPSGYGRRRRRSVSGPIMIGAGNSTGFEYMSPLSQHWKTILDNHARKMQENATATATTDEAVEEPKMQPVRVKGRPIQAKTKEGADGGGGGSTQFDENIGFSVMMPADYYRSIKVNNPAPYECRAWILTAMGLCFGLGLAAVLACVLSYRMRRLGSGKSKDPFYNSPSPSVGVGIGCGGNSSSVNVNEACSKKSMSGSHSHHHHHHRGSKSGGGTHGHASHGHGTVGVGVGMGKITNSKYARDTSLYRP